MVTVSISYSMWQAKQLLKIRNGHLPSSVTILEVFDIDIKQLCCFMKMIPMCIINLFVYQDLLA